MLGFELFERLRPIDNHYKVCLLLERIIAERTVLTPELKEHLLALVKGDELKVFFASNYDILKRKVSHEKRIKSIRGLCGRYKKEGHPVNVKSITEGNRSGGNCKGEETKKSNSRKRKKKNNVLYHVGPKDKGSIFGAALPDYKADRKPFSEKQAFITYLPFGGGKKK